MTGSVAPPASVRRIRWALTGLLLAVLLATTAAAPVHAATPVATHIVQLEPGVSPADGAALVRSAGGRVTGKLPIINGLAVRLPVSGVKAVQRDGRVKALTANARVAPQSTDIDPSSLATAYSASVQATKVWGSATGRGVGVAVIDTGIAGGLADFKGDDGRSRVIASAVVNPAATTAKDTFGHGTHVAGILAGDGTRRTDSLRGQYVGIAPEANLISIKAADDAGRATVLDIIYGLQFAVDHRAKYNIRVVNLSLESTTPNSYKTDPLDAAVESAWLKGLVVVAAAGNRGTDADAVQYAPGNDPYVISVGALDDQMSQADGDDSRATWSSRGITQDGFSKPEIHAPGARIVSTLAPGSAFASLCPTCIVDLEMIRAGGTSMAAPMVSGAAALLLQKYPNLTPNQVKGVLIGSSRLVNNRFPAVDVYSAIKSVAAGNVPVANQGLTPNPLVSGTTGDIDYTRSSWSRSSWSTADSSLGLDFTRSSWSRSSWSSTDSSGIETSRSSWSRSSWSTSWTK